MTNCDASEQHLDNDKPDRQGTSSARQPQVIDGEHRARARDWVPGSNGCGRGAFFFFFFFLLLPWHSPFEGFVFTWRKLDLYLDAIDALLFGAITEPHSAQRRRHGSESSRKKVNNITVTVTITSSWSVTSLPEDLTPVREKKKK